MILNQGNDGSNPFAATNLTEDQTDGKVFTWENGSQHEYCEKCGDCILCDPEHYCPDCKECAWDCKCEDK